MHRILASGGARSSLNRREPLEFGTLPQSSGARIKFGSAKPARFMKPRSFLMTQEILVGKSVAARCTFDRKQTSEILIGSKQ